MYIYIYLHVYIGIGIYGTTSASFYLRIIGSDVCLNFKSFVKALTAVKLKFSWVSGLENMSLLNIIRFSKQILRNLA